MSERKERTDRQEVIAALEALALLPDRRERIARALELLRDLGGIEPLWPDLKRLVRDDRLDRAVILLRNAPPPERPPSVAGSVVRGLALLLLVLGAAVGLHSVLSGQAALFSTIGSGVVLTVAGSYFFGDSCLLAGLVGIVASLGVGPAFSDHLAARSGERVVDLSVAAAPAHPDAVSFSFRDGRLDTGYVGHAAVGGSHRTRSSSGSAPSHHYVTPLVPEGWTIAAPVPAWAVCDAPSPRTLESCRAYWRGPLPRTAFVIRALDEGPRKAARDAEQTLRLEGASGAPVLLLCDDPEAELRGRLTTGLLFSGIAVALVVLGAIVLRLAPWLQELADRRARRAEGNGAS